MSESKPFCISKRLVWEAWLRVKANDGAAGVDGKSIAEFERNLERNLYKLWNRLSSGCYFPPPVREVEIPKRAGGGVRKLGVPTVADRVAQTAVKLYLEPDLELVFHEDSYGYRPGRSALDAVGECRERCWRTDWVLDVDIKSFFDTLDHELVLRAVAHHTSERWVLLYVRRWLKAPVQRSDGTLVERECGSPQGSAISPVLANLFLHYAFDAWMAREFPVVSFERYSDDIVVHCKSEKQARFVRDAIAKRLACCGLELHPDKTRIVYCKDAERSGSYEHESFDFLGYRFRQRPAKSKDGEIFISFLPAVSADAAKAMRQEIRFWRLHLRSGATLKDLADDINLIVRGWINYYGHFYKSVLYSTLKRINNYLMRWAQKKYKRLRYRAWRAWKFLASVLKREPNLFAHWKLVGTDGWTTGAV